MAGTFFQKTIFVALCAVTAVCSAAPVMTRGDFNAIELGTPADTVIQNYGEPYSIKSRKDGSQEYRYIEKLSVGDEIVEENNYYLLIKNGKVVSKRYNQELPPAYDEIYDDDPNDFPN